MSEMFNVREVEGTILRDAILPLHPDDKERLVLIYDEEYETCTHMMLLVLKPDPIGDEEFPIEISTWPCTEDGLSPMDTPYNYRDYEGEEDWKACVDKVRHGEMIIR